MKNNFLRDNIWGAGSPDIIKAVYFVRHGESEYNAHPEFFADDAPLSERGRRQTEELAKRVAHLSIDVILSSTLLRAKQTADKIRDTTQKPIEYIELLREIRLPSMLEGRRADDPEMAALLQKIRENNRSGSAWRHSDEENFHDRMARAKRILEYLVSRDEKNILVASHGLTIKTVVACMLFGEKMTPAEYYGFAGFVSLTNTGITLCEYASEGKWKLTTWNDLAHLG